ncbi:MAG: membrane protease subunit, stomatin/prohibitin [Spirochaetes bacterium GWF1_49_6]|nr:MAG: membrane protease subunit, stomatin/prohibitin [Spirochaetes bacterium GWF1_49_6]
MLGFRFIKFQPNYYVLKYKKGRVVREGLGLAFNYYSPTTSLVAVPVGSTDTPFIFTESTSDFQSVTVQGQVTFRVSDPKKIAGLLNYTLDNNTKNYISDDPQKLPQRVITVVQVLTKKFIENLPLREAIRSSEPIASGVASSIRADKAIESLGIEILGLAVVAILPTEDTARALEATAREQILKEADDAIYTRRNSAVEQERRIKENELNTEIAVENKKRQILEAQKEAERAIQMKDHEMKQAEMNFTITNEERKKKLVELSADNARKQADTRAYGVSVVLKAVEGIKTEVLQVLSQMGMDTDKLIAIAFRGMAENAEKIGELNISPDLLKELLNKKK